MPCPPLPRLAAALAPLLLGLSPPVLAAKPDKAAAAPSVRGPKKATLPVYRSFPDSDKLYVQADLGDGELRLFLVDTGASVSVVTPEVAAALGLVVSNEGDELIGLGGRTAWNRAVLPTVKLGPFKVNLVEAAVGVPGVPTQAGLAPVAGILGNNVWGRFQLAVDYPADLIEIARPGVLDLPDSAAPMTFNGQHVSTMVGLTGVAAEGAPPTASLLLEIDTGARGLVVTGPRAFRGGDAAALAATATIGEEVILGVGADDEVPQSNFVRETRRIPLSGVELGGMRLDRALELTWLNPDGETPDVGPPGMIGLGGYEILAGHRVIFDYGAGRFALGPSTHKPDFHDVHSLLAKQLKRARDPDSRMRYAEVMAWMNREEEAQAALDAVLKARPGDPEALVLRGRIFRVKGEIPEALALLRQIPPADLAAQHEVIAVVNGLWLAGEVEAAVALGVAASEAAPTEPDAWVALSDARRMQGDWASARAALREANRLSEYPDGHLFRRAWLASAEGDGDGALSFLRRLLDRSPAWGATLWAYGQVAEPEDAPLYHQDVDTLLSRLHPADRPLDFAALGFRALGDHARAAALASEGMKRDCPSAPEESSRENCEAWYLAAGAGEAAAAEAQITAALTIEPDRPEFLDTASVVWESLGRLREAAAASREAAAAQPDDVYLLWQAWRLERAAASPP